MSCLVYKLHMMTIFEPNAYLSQPILIKQKTKDLLIPNIIYRYGLIIPSKSKGTKDFLSTVSEMRKPNKVFGGDGSSSDDNLEEEEEEGSKALDWRSRAVAVSYKTISCNKNSSQDVHFNRKLLRRACSETKPDKWH
jgi:hypothetical protein